MQRYIGSQTTRTISDQNAILIRSALTPLGQGQPSKSKSKIAKELGIRGDILKKRNHTIGRSTYHPVIARLQSSRLLHRCLEEVVKLKVLQQRGDAEGSQEGHTGQFGQG